MSQIDNKRLAKNTVVLYARSFFVLILSLFTSRITLQALGVDNYGINSAVGGVIGMFHLVSGSLSKSISRFVTFELGHGDKDKLKKIFSTAINIQLGIGAIIILLGETVGVWFLNTQMNIPEGRMYAANWVLQCALWSFFIGLTQTPYSACIIGHEKMKVFAYFNITDTVLRVINVLLLYISPFDKLITIAILGFVVSVSMRMAQRIYCSRKFEECHYQFVFDKSLMKEMTGFAGWSFLLNTTWIFTNQGVNILINIFFGVSFNAARSLAHKIEGIVKRFTADFTVALNPQITKSYAAGEIDEMNKLICRGTRFTYYLMFVLSLPLIFEAYYAMYIWLGMVPDYTILFYRLSMVATLITLIGGTGFTACMATGDIKWYSIIMTGLSCMIFPLTWIAYKMGLAVEWSYIIYIGIYTIINIVRPFIMKRLWGFPVMMFVKEAILPIFWVTIISLIFPSIIYFNMEQSFLRAVLVSIVSLVSGFTAVYTVGINKAERTMLRNKIREIINEKILQKKSSND